MSSCTLNNLLCKYPNCPEGHKENAVAITLEIIDAWQGTDLTSYAWNLAAARVWESEPSERQRTSHAQDSLASLAQRSFAMGFESGKEAKVSCRCGHTKTEHKSLDSRPFGKWNCTYCRCVEYDAVTDEPFSGGLGDEATQRAWMRYADEQEVPHDHEDEEAFKYGFNANAEQSLNIRRAAEAVVNHFYRYDNCECGVPVSLHGNLTSCCLSSNGSAELSALKGALSRGWLSRGKADAEGGI